MNFVVCVLNPPFLKLKFMLTLELQVVQCLVLWLATWCQLHCSAAGEEALVLWDLGDPARGLGSSGDRVLYHSICCEVTDFSADCSYLFFRVWGRRGWREEEVVLRSKGFLRAVDLQWLVCSFS